MKGTQRGPGRSFNVAFVCTLVLVASAASVRAVIFKSTGDPSYNTNAPSGSLTNSGWQYEGSWGGFLGVPIAPRYFIVARHTGGDTNLVFRLNGLDYHPLDSSICPDADLRVWRVAETFPSYVSLYTNSNEVGKHCVVFGRGGPREDPVIIDGQTNGWRTGGSDGVKRWGENDISSIEDGGGSFGDLLRAAFNRGGGSNECHLSVGDSSGGVFIKESGTWKLAGVNYAVDGDFSFTGSDTDSFGAAMMDVGGLYVGDDAHGWTFYTNQVADIPSGFYSTRISTNVAWINSVIDFLPGDDLRITAIQVIGDDVSVSFATGSNRLYHVDRNDDLGSGTWTTFTNNVPGTGGIVSVLDANAGTLPQRFYRVGLIQ